MRTAFILSAGLGTRMRPFTLINPKPLLTLVNKPIIFWHIDKLIEVGIKKIVINIHHLGYKLKGFISFYVSQKLKRNDIKVYFLDEPNILGTGGALYNARQFINNDNFIMINSDIIYGCYLQDIYNYHKKNSPLATLVIKKTHKSNLKQVATDSANNITKIGPIDISPDNYKNKEFCFTGIHIINSEIFKYVEKDKFQCIIRDIYKNACVNDAKILKGYEIKEYWNDIGNIDDYYNAHKDILNKKIII